MDDDLADRVSKFNALQLPGQPQMVHSGTALLVFDLWWEVQDLRTRLTAVANAIQASCDAEAGHIDG